MLDRGEPGSLVGVETCDAATRPDPVNWTATRDNQGTQTTSPSPGSYTVVYAGTDEGSFSVSSDGSQLQNVGVATGLTCTPSSNESSGHIQFPSLAINSDGSFNASATEDGIVDMEPATFTYTFNGHFHGKTSSGTDRFAGQLSEVVTFSNGNQVMCTTNPTSWTATGS
jgi:hypothetical protein